MSEEDIDDTLERETDEAEEASLEEWREEEVLDEEGVPDEEQEADLAVAIRRQLGLEKEELGEAPAELADVEQLPRPRRPDEFLCSSCFQLKRRSQLADPAGSRCIDCVNNSAR